MSILNLRYYLVRSAIVFICFLITAGFANKTGNKFLKTGTTISIVQENDGFAISVKTEKEINVRFYMFSVEGRLIKELNIYGSKKINISQLERGIYIYDFFY